MNGRRLGSSMLLLTCVMLVAAPLHAQVASPTATPEVSLALQAGGSDASPLEQARALYEASRFADAVDLLTSAIERGRLTGDDVTAARELRARALVKAGRRLEAKEAFKSMLRADAQYRPDAMQVPPDEMDIFNLAKSEIDSELLQAGRRFPASIGFLYGMGQSVNQDLVDLASSNTAYPEAPNFEASKEFGAAVRIPIRPRWSADFEITRLRATVSDEVDPTTDDHATYVSSATPIVASIVRSLSSSSHWHVNALAGVGMMPSEAIVEFTHQHGTRFIPVQIVGRATGPFVHGGVEAEFLPTERFAIAARVTGRYAKSGDLKWNAPTFEVYEGFPESQLGKRSEDFSGLAAILGLRFYIGY